MSTKNKFRIFAYHDDAVRNGSIRKVIYYPASLRGTSIFMNGDYMGFLPVELNSVADCDLEAERLLKEEGMREYDRKTFDDLAPVCFR